jgi:hypothetical protein
MNKNKKQQPKQLSPENYIRTKARTLPIDSCYVNDDWKESGLANLIIIRKHSNEKYTFGIYLVDTYALGTKDTFFNFNQPKDVVDDILERGNFVPVDYNLAHNIIYGANEFAIENGFKIHKDFNNTTQYILEKDDEKIPIIDIEFGRDGEPFLIY